MTNPQPLPALYRFGLYRGDTRVFEHHFADDPVPPATTGTPIDISDWVFEAQYRAEDGTLLATEACVITDGPGGIMRRTLTHTQAQLLVPGAVTWDLQATKVDGDVRTYLKNKSVQVEGDVSQ